MSDPQTILVVDDQPALLANIQFTLQAAGYRVLTAADGVEAIDLLRTQQIDLVLADIAMPRLNGYQLFEQMQQEQAWAFIPFILLTARAMDSDIRYGKQLGVDDYLTKPVEPEDLLATVQGKLRRADHLAALERPQMAAPAGHETLTAGNLRVDTRQHRVWLSEHEISLSAREFALLAHLARHPNRLFSGQELVRITHDLETDEMDAGSLIRPLILSLRRKIGQAARIENVRGVGYRLIQVEAD